MTAEKSKPGGPGEPGPYKVRLVIIGVWGWWWLAWRLVWPGWRVWGLGLVWWVVVGIVGDGGFFPGGVDGWIGTEAELDDEVRDDAEEAGVVEIVVLDEIEEAVGAEGRPCAGDGEGELAAGGVEFNLVGVGGFLFQEGWF